MECLLDDFGLVPTVCSNAAVGRSKKGRAVGQYRSSELMPTIYIKIKTSICIDAASLPVNRCLLFRLCYNIEIFDTGDFCQHVGNWCGRDTRRGSRGGGGAGSGAHP